MLLTSCMSKTLSTSPEIPEVTAQVYISLVAGLTITSLTTIFLPVSGAHANPSITLAAVSIHRISAVRGAGYLLAQCGGGVAGASAMLCLYGPSAYRADDPTIATATMMECMLTCLMVTVYLTVTEQGCPQPQLSIGLVYTTCLAAYRGPLNPACALAQAFLTNRWQNIGLFWAAPVLGGVGGALFYEHVISDRKDVKVVLHPINEDFEVEEDEKQFTINSFNDSYSLSSGTPTPLPRPPSLPLPRRARHPLAYSVHTVIGESYPQHLHAQLVTLEEPGAEKELFEEDDEELNNKRYTKSGINPDTKDIKSMP